MKRLENKTAIVTGGNSGIGKATAILFAKEGADLVLCARRKEALDEVAEECRKYGVQVVTVKADVSSHEDCSAVVKAAVDTFGKVDILVNNAGIVDKHRPITECTDEWWDEIIAIDQSSLFYMMKDTIPHMMASGKGSIINVSSIGGVFGNGGISYSAAKSAALAMTKNVAIQLAPNGIVVCDYVIEELRLVTERKFPAKRKFLDRFFMELPFELVYTPKELDLNEFPEMRDVKDSPILATAIMEGIDVFLTGDKDFLVLDVETPEILTMKDFLEQY